MAAAASPTYELDVFGKLGYDARKKIGTISVKSKTTSKQLHELLVGKFFKLESKGSIASMDRAGGVEIALRSGAHGGSRKSRRNRKSARRSRNTRRN